MQPWMAPRINGELAWLDRGSPASSLIMSATTPQVDHISSISPSNDIDIVNSHEKQKQVPEFRYDLLNLVYVKYSSDFPDKASGL